MVAYRKKYTERLLSEKDFYDDLARQGWVHDNDKIDPSIIPRNMMPYWSLVEKHVEKNRNPNFRILDCGCGFGVFSVLIAKKGCFVNSIDISESMIDVTRKLAMANGVARLIDAEVMPVESLSFPDESFDLVVGTRILHHSDVEQATREIHRVLKTNRQALFWECTEKNVILKMFRAIKRTLPLRALGTKFEHPLTKSEIESMKTIFEGKLEILPATFFFFQTLDHFVFKQKWALLSTILCSVDELFDSVFPSLRHYSFHQIFVFHKG